MASATSVAVMAALIALAAALSTAHAQQLRGAPRDAAPTALDLSKYAGSDHTLMFVGAHPDDIATTVGGTVALATQQGTNCVYVVTTNGDKGFHKNRTMTSQHLALIRYYEQLNSAKVLGVPPENVVMLDYEDGVLNNVPEIELRQAIVAEIRRFKPDAIFVWSPYYDFKQYKRGLEHPDHRTTGMRTLDAAYPSARDYLAFPSMLKSGLEPWITSEIFLYAFDNIEVYVDIDSVLDVKTKSLEQHVSQYTNATAVADSLKDLGQYIAAQTTSGATYAEGFTPVLELS